MNYLSLSLFGQTCVVLVVCAACPGSPRLHFVFIIADPAPPARDCSGKEEETLCIASVFVRTYLSHMRACFILFFTDCNLKFPLTLHHHSLVAQGGGTARGIPVAARALVARSNKWACHALQQGVHVIYEWM